jgi:uncharacterized RDD family membrane protein YckC
LSTPRSLLDASYSFETPEGFELQVDLAGPIVRTLAFVIDLMIRAGFMLGLLIILLFLQTELGWALWLLFYFLIEWWYPVVFEIFRNGQTPGKKSMGIQVIQDDLAPITFSSSLIRNLLRAVDFFPSFYTFGYLCMCMHPHFKRIGDVAAGTLVVYKKDAEEYEITDLEEEPQFAPFELEEDEQSAIVEFTMRKETLSEGRQQELASILDPVLKNESKDRVTYLRSVGAWLLGKR